MNDDNPDSSPDPNHSWDYVEPECRWAPQCHPLLIPGGCEECESLNPNPDLPRDEDGEPYSVPDALKYPTQ